MNPIIPLGILGLGAGLFVYSKKSTPAQKLEAQQKSAKFVNANWDTQMSVKDVQVALNQLGASPVLQPDGVLGPKTVAAIKSFQAQAGITVDGIIGPQTETALHHAITGGTAAAGWFLLNDGEDDGLCEVGASAIERINASRPGRGSGYRIEGGHIAVGAGGWGSSDWTAPSVADITNDPQQRMQIGLLKMAQAKAQAAFPGSKAAGFDYSFLPDQGASEQAEATAAYCGLEAERQAALNAVSGDYVPGEEGEEYAAGDYGDEEEFAVGADDWSAPDESEIYGDPVQMAQLEMQQQHYQQQQYAPYEYGYVPQQGAYGLPMQPGVYGPPYLPYPTSPQGFYTQPGYTSAMPTLGAVPGVSNVTQQGYEIAPGQAGRRF